MAAGLREQVADEAAMVSFGERLGAVCGRTGVAVVFLRGDLGMGKTTLCRGILRAFGHRGPVKSPTYTLVEPYEFGDKSVFHFDLYRLGDPEELEYMGIREYFAGNSLCLVEWAEKGATVLPAADLVVTIESATAGRWLNLVAQSATGSAAIDALRS